MPRRTTAASAFKPLVAEIRSYCAAHEDPANATKYARYFKEGYDSWGLLDTDHPFWNEMEPGWYQKHAHRGIDFFLAVGEELFQSGKYEEGALAIRFLKHFLDELAEPHLPALARWFEGGIRNWAHTDVFCAELLQPRLVSGAIVYQALAPWRDSPLRFQCRAVPVSLIALVKKKEPVKPLLRFVKPLMLHPERVVHQGMGWFLREAWKKDPQPVEALLAEYRNTAPRTIYQYATEKMSPEQKAIYRRDKK